MYPRTGAHLETRIREADFGPRIEVRACRSRRVVNGSARCCGIADVDWWKIRVAWDPGNRPALVDLLQSSAMRLDCRQLHSNIPGGATRASRSVGIWTMGFRAVEDRPTPGEVYNWRLYSEAIIIATGSLLCVSNIGNESCQLTGSGQFWL